jgi:hypothetical protein
MPVDLSPAVQESLRIRRQPLKHLVIRSSPILAQVRRAQRTFSTPRNGVQAPPAEVTDRLEASGEQFRTEGWSFIEGFFNDDFHRALVDTWPSRAYFNPMTSIAKSYDFGFKWIRGGTDPEELHKFPVLRSAYDALRSDEISRRISDYWADGVERGPYSITASWATAGSALAPHKDAVAHDAQGASFMNFVIFVDGTGGPTAGGTCIYGDGDYKDLRYEPTNLRNSAIVYKSSANYWHGFPPMRAKTFRWTINVQYAAVDYRP